MTDRELLENAARAAGIGPIIRIDETTAMIGPSSRIRIWNPIDDDGDALRLAVTLKLDITFYDGFELIRIEDGRGDIWAEGDYQKDMPAVVRRTIVRAAAAMEAS